MSAIRSFNVGFGILLILTSVVDIYDCMASRIAQASTVVVSSWEKKCFSFQVLRSPLNTHTQMW
jgi:hypothetical protein